MFAVPGWTLGPLKTEQAQDAPAKDKRSSKKRKRNHNGEASSVLSGRSSSSGGGDDAGNVTRENVAELWKQHVGSNHRNSTDGTSKSSNNNRSEAVDTKPVQPRGGEEASRHSRKEHDGNESKQAPKADKKKKSRRKGSGVEAARPTAEPQQYDTPAHTQIKLTPMQAAMRQKLISARFRHLNQTLYTAPSSEAQQLFHANPSFFEEYHAGFRQQVSSWPENPVDRFLQELRQRGGLRSHGKHPKANPAGVQQPLPRSSGTCVVADLGCGDARLARELQKTSNKLAIKMLSYDLQSDSPLVTKADISHLPLESGSVNIAIFCLALMGTNWIDFVEEAWRILHWKGELWVAEIKSRFARVKDRQVEHSIGKKRKGLDKESRRKEEAEQEEEQLQVEVDGSTSSKGQTDVSSFVRVLERRGFVLRGHDGIDLSNKMFVRLHFTKSKTPTRGKHAAERQAERQDDQEPSVADETTVLKPCLYKTR